MDDPGVSSEPFDALMTIVEQAIDDTKPTLIERKLKITQVNMQIKTTATNEKTEGLKFSYLSKLVDISAEHKGTNTNIQTISLSFEPTPKRIKELERVESELINAIKMISNAVANAIQKLPSFKLKEATVEINFGIAQSNDGSVSILLGGGLNISKEAVNVLSIKLENDGS
jgi:hypothetical protein